jgi:hypothetical protein
MNFSLGATFSVSWKFCLKNCPLCIFRKQQLQAQEKAKKLLKSLGINQDIKLTKYEMIIASNLVRLGCT